MASPLELRAENIQTHNRTLNSLVCESDECFKIMFCNLLYITCSFLTDLLNKTLNIFCSSSVILAPVMVDRGNTGTRKEYTLRKTPVHRRTTCKFPISPRDNFVSPVHLLA